MHILIIPGWKDTPQHWHPVAAALETNGYRVSILDYTTPENEDVEEQANEAEYFLNTKTLVVGSSIGGRIAVQLLSRKHHHIVGAVLMSTPSIPHAGFLAKLFAFIGKILMLPFIIVPKFIRTRVAKLFHTIFRISDDSVQYSRIISQDQTSLLQIIKTPVKLVWGAKDRTVSPAIGEKMDEILSHSDYIEVVNAGDNLHRHQSKLTADIIDGFARSC